MPQPMAAPSIVTPAPVAGKHPAGSPSSAKAAPRRREDPAGTSASSAASSATSSPPVTPPAAAKQRVDKARAGVDVDIDVDVDTHEQPQQQQQQQQQQQEEEEGEAEGDGANDARAKSLSVDRSSRPHFKEGIRLAEMGKWSTLVERLALGETQLARHKDHHGMLPLHWACTEDDVPTEAVRALLAAFPAAVLTRNNAQYLPLHLAVRARVGAETLRALAAARPSSLLAETPAGKTALALAREVQLPPAAMSVLEHFEREYRDLSADSDDDDTALIEHAKRDYALQSQRLRESMLHPPALAAADLRDSSQRHNSHLSQQQQQQQQQQLYASGDGAGGSFLSFDASFGPLDPIAADIARASGQSFGSQSSGAPPMVTSLSFVGGALVQPKESLRIDEEVATPGGSLVPPPPSAPPARAQSSRGAPRAAPAVAPPARAATSRGGAPALELPFSAPLFDSDAHAAAVCGVCYKKFGVFRKKYQCKSCFAYLCKKHVAGKLALPGFSKKRSVCGDCYRMHRNGPVPVTLPGAAGSAAAAVAGPSAARTVSSSASSDAVASRSASAASGSAIAGPLRPHAGTLASARSASVASSGGGGGGFPGSTSHSGQSVGDGLEAMAATAGGRGALGGSLLMATRPARAESTHSIVGRPSTVVGPQTSMRYSTTNARGRGQSAALAARARNNSSLLLADRPHSDTAASGHASLSESDPTSASLLLRASMVSMQEVAALQQRIATLEDVNKLLLTRVADQEKQYDEAMLLLTQTMTRVAEMEMRVPNERKSYRGTGGSTTASERASELLEEADMKFSFPTPFTEKFD